MPVNFTTRPSFNTTLALTVWLKDNLSAVRRQRPRPRPRPIRPDALPAVWKWRWMNALASHHKVMMMTTQRYSFAFAESRLETGVERSGAEWSGAGVSVIRQWPAVGHMSSSSVLSVRISLSWVVIWQRHQSTLRLVLLFLASCNPLCLLSKQKLSKTHWLFCIGD